MNNYAANNLKLLLFSICSCMILSCSSQKDNATSRSLQNLSARYNYIYNANVILTNHQNELAETYVENYDLVLPVYLGPEVDRSEANVSLNLKPMDDIIKKAQVIILDKSYSNYLDESYLLLGKANFYNGNYFNAAEYFDYTAKAYRNTPNSFLEALNWKARSLMQLRRIREANQVLDSLEYVLPSVKKPSNRAEPLATLAQMCIYLGNDTAAVSYLKDAIKASNQSQHKIRWTYILAQLYEKNKDFQNAMASYRKVAKSNAPFEMYFNANLGRIKINALLNGTKVNRQKELLALLKDDKNFDYNDQVYFQIAETYAADEAYTEAEKYYHISVRNSTVNAYQKGLSYLKIADLNFKYFKNYLKAKAYYDSTVNTLPKNYPGYELILKKSLNLQYLTDRYETIALQDSLQAIAKLPETARNAKIEALASPVVQTQSQAQTNTGFAGQPSYTAGNNPRLQAQSSFYFSNPTAVSLGFSDFKKRWGNRKLENNWRQSIRSSAQETNQELANNINGLPAGPDQVAAAPKDKDALIKQYTESLPLSPELMNSSNQKIIDAYYEIASFYLQELNDQKEADLVYQTLLRRFPSNSHLAATWYSLFLIHKETDPEKSNTYKNNLLTAFPNSPYAKILLDPAFSLKQSELEANANKKYNDVFEQYTKKDFSGVIQQVNETTAQGNANYLAPQFFYLKAIAIGRTSPVDSLLRAFNSIVTQFPDDQLVRPLVQEHIAYINAHMEDFRKRTIALPDFDPNEPPFNNISSPKISNPIPVVAQTNTPKVIVVNKTATLPQKIAEEKPLQPNTVEKTAEIPKPAVPEKKSFAPFTDAKSTTYYYVIHVADAALTLSSSRFGIGQFNRGNYAEENLKHQLKEFDNDQLIYVGNFTNFEDAKTYASGITPQLKQIMKVPVSIYTNFIISKENFDLIKNRTLLNTYMEFYKNNY